VVSIDTDVISPIDKNINSTCDLIVGMMNADNVKQKVQTSVLSVVKLALNSNMYIGGITYQVKSIIADNKFDQNDIPAILKIIFQTKAFLQTAVGNAANIAVTFNAGSLKYIIFGVIHYILITENTDPVLVQIIDTTFSTAWDSFILDPEQLANDVAVIANKCFPCCGKSKNKSKK